MKTETQIAKENVEDYEDPILNKFGTDKRKSICKEHLASCQRFLEFLEERKEVLVNLSQSHKTCICDELNAQFGLEIDDYKEKITDLKEAIKIYREANIK